MPKTDYKEPKIKNTKSYYENEISRKRWNPNKEEKKLVSETYNRFVRLKEARADILGRNIQDIWDNAEAIMLGNIADIDTNIDPETDVDTGVDQEEDERSTLIVPVTHSVVDSIKAEWQRQHTTGRVVPSSDPMDEPKAEIMDLARQYVEERNNIRLVDDESHYDVLTYGNTIQSVLYKLEKRRIQVLDRVEDDGTPIYKEKIIDWYDDICIQKEDIKEIYIDDGARKPDFSDAKDVIHRKVVEYSRFEAEYNDYDNHIYVKRGGCKEQYDLFKKPEDIEDDDVEVLWWWNESRDFLRIVANGVLLCNKPIPYDDKRLPFCGAGDNHRPGSFYWIGEPELIQSLQEELNTLRRLRTDATKMATLPPIFMPTTGIIEDLEDELYIDPGRIYPYSGQVTPTQMKIQTDMNAILHAERELKEDIGYATGMNRQNEGTSQPDETATKAAIRKEATLRRIAQKIATSSMMLEKRRGELIISRILQYYTEPKLTLIAGPDKIAEYKKKVEGGELKKSDYAFGEDGVYEKKFRSIRIDNKEIKVKTDGPEKKVKLNIRESKGYSFFKTTPELMRGQYDFVVVPDIDIPVTKAQKIEMIDMMYDRLQQNPVINSPDGKYHLPDGSSLPMPRGIVKLTETILKEHGFQWEDFAPDNVTGDFMAEQALKECAVMASGTPLPPTPLASPEHIQVESDFMEKNVDQSNTQLMQIFNEHITAEQQMLEQIVNTQRISKERQNAITQKGSEPGVPMQTA